MKIIYTSWVIENYSDGAEHSTIQINKYENGNN